MSRLCDPWTDGPGYCRSADGVQFFIIGWRCRAHTPARLAGREDLVPDPERTAPALYRKAFGRDKPVTLNRQDVALLDQIAIAKGKRRSSPRKYREAQAAQDERRKR